MVPFTSDLKKIDAGIDRVRNGSATALYDAIFLGSQALSRRQGRKVMVVITDGGDTMSQMNYKEALRAAQEADAEATAVELGKVKTELASSPELSKVADGIIAQFTSIRSRAHNTYGAIVGSTGTLSDDMMAQVGALGKDNKALTDAMTEFDKAISGSFQTQLDVVDAWSVRSRVMGLAMLIFAILSCSAAWWVVQTNVVSPLRSLALRL